MDMLFWFLNITFKLTLFTS